MTLIYFSPVLWDSFTQRPHEFVRYFHLVTGGRVLWVDPYPTRLPKIDDLQRANTSRTGSSDVTYSWLQVYSASAIPVEPLPLGSSINRWLFWSTFIAKIQKAVQGDSLVVGIGKPSALALYALRRLPVMWSFYDAMDDFPAFYSGLSRRSMAQHEREVINSVGKVFVSSSSLVTRLRTMGAEPHLITNACASRNLPDISKAAGLSRTMGYIGTVGAWFDWSFVAKIAQLAPNLIIKIVGPIFSSPPHPLPENVILQPACSHAQAVEEMKSFRVGLIPFKLNSLTKSVDPIKYYEYRAMGLPVISTAFGEMARRRGEPGVYIIDDAAHAPAALEMALNQNPKQEEVVLFRRENDWDKRFESADLFGHLRQPPSFELLDRRMWS